jgi:replicative DNA helicase
MIVNATAEGAMLGLYLDRPDAWTRWPTTREDYGDGQCRALFDAMAALVARDTPLDFVTVPAELARQGHAQIPASWVADLRVQSPGNGSGLLAELRDARARRALVRAGTTLSQAATDPTCDPSAVLEEATEAAFATVREGTAADAPDLQEHTYTWLKSLEAGNPKPSVRTGFAYLDYLLEALPRGEVTVVAARPGVGKSSFAMQVGVHNAERGRHVLFCSAEMTAHQLIERMKSQQARVPLQHIRRGQFSSADKLALVRPLPPMRLSDKAGMTTQTVCDLAARVGAQTPLDLVIVDHLHHLSDARTRFESRYDQIGSMVNRLKTLAKQRDCVVLLVCQLNRQAADGVPTMAQLRDAGTIEEYANVILLLHAVQPDTDGDPITTCEVRVEKHRGGATGLVRLAWIGARTQFADEDRAA